MKCEVPSFVSDFVFVEMWMDSEGGTYFPGTNEGKASRYNIPSPFILNLYILQPFYKCMRRE